MSVVSFKCPNCDGGLRFCPDTQTYQCDHCNSLFSQAQLEAMDQIPEEAGENIGVFHCPSCGAEIMAEQTTAATTCYYCHNAVVLNGRLAGELLPDLVIPFEVTKEQAVRSFQKYVDGKFFIPSGFFTEKHQEKMMGVYFPYWLYDATFDCSAKGSGEKISRWTSGETRYTKTEYYTIRREGDISFSNLPENALSKANVKLLSGVMPYDFGKAKEFHAGYLSGFRAECRDIRQAQVIGDLQRKMRKAAQKSLLGTITGYHSVSIQKSDYQMKQEKLSYVLLPVWTITYTGPDGNFYYYAVNGQTGRTYGELPLDHRKLLAVSGLISMVIFLFGLLWGYLV